MTAMLDSLRPADSARSAETTQHRRPTSKDILAGGYNCQREIPEPVECEFCGRKLYHEALVMGRTVLMFAPFPQRCTCDRAKAKWAEADAEEARQKAEAEKEAAQAKRRAKIERLLGRSGIKKRFQQRTFANFIRDTPERRRCYDTAKTYADSFPQRAERGEGLYIEGTYGTGKTHLAAAIALQLIGCGVPVVCKTSGDLLADIKEAFDSGDATEYEILKAYKTVDLLIVDTKKAEPDFKGVMLGGRAVMFEAKSTGTGRLNKDRVLPEQVKKLDSYTTLGAHCFIVATFDGLRVYRIPWTVWRSMKQRYGRNYVTEADIKEYAVRFGPGFTPDLLRGIPTMYDINPLSNVSDVLTAFCGMPYGTQPETEEWRAAVYRFSRFMNWTTPERFIPVTEIRREQPNMKNPIFTFMGVPITEDSASKLKEAMKKCGVSALEVAGVCERFAKIARATLDELPDGNKEEEHDD